MPHPRWSNLTRAQSHSSSLAKSFFAIDGEHRHLCRSRSPSEFGSQDHSYIFPRPASVRRYSAPPVLNAQSPSGEPRGRSRTRTPRRKHTGKSNYRHSSSSLRLATTDSRSSSAPPQSSLPVECPGNDGGCETPSTVPRISNLFSTRRTPLPKLGGVKPCGGCGFGVSYFESVMGPEGIRFHQRCLRCTECGKNMESGSRYELTSEGRMQFCCQHCLMEKSDVVVVESEGRERGRKE